MPKTSWMKERNMGRLDRSVRLTAAACLTWLIMTGRIEGTTADILAAAAGILIISSAMGYCVVYRLLDIRTDGKKKEGGGGKK